ncbi:Hypothetical predicted protein [Mytilus galloprovincialis]|uniref:Uncharacterized protein n=1 Tax=Mytilus galloprovincialis TaxID=29158 RepID=A0A8B6CL54_MYTGA|nr:Hypothetical predicted protein [Mytilus galloprovincialis]
MSIPKRNSTHEIEKHGIEPELKDINPGLFAMKLNLMYIDHVQIEHTKISLLAAKQEEHQIVHAVIDLMLTLLDNPLQNRRRIAYNIEKLEQNIKANPKHLNTLADLAVLYRTINADDKAVAIYETTNEILISNDPNDIKEEAVCVLEQGYAVLCDELSQNEFEAQHKLADSLQRMQLEKNISVGKKHDLLCQASKHSIIAQQMLYRSLNCKTKDNVCYGKTSSMMLFKKGIDHLENTAYLKEHVYIWKYYFARACNSVTLISSTNDIKACELYLSVLGNLLKDNKSYAVYRARAYACIGHRLVTRKEVHQGDLKHSPLSNDEIFQVLMKDPLSAFDYANAEHAHDEIVLNRKGKSLLFRCKFRPETPENQKLRYLTEADTALSLSLSLNPRMDRLNFSIRMNVYFEMSILKNISNVSRYNFVQKALEDGKATILVNLKGNDVCKVAEICQRLAKYPKFFLYGPKAVTNKEYLYIALDYLNQYICAKGQTYFQAFAIGTIHYDMGEFRTALEWHKRAFLLSDYKRAIVRQFRKYQYTPSTGNIEYDWRTSSFPHPVIEPASDHLDFEYDYFAIMSHENSGWIECFLKKQLSTQMLYNDMTFTACPEVITYESCSRYWRQPLTVSIKVEMSYSFFQMIF